MNTSTVPTKGHHIRFVKGTYAGRNGWIDSSRKKGKSNYRHVIVAADPEDQDSQEKCTRVKITSFCDPHPIPSSFEEAALQQHPDIEVAMIKLAEMFTQCSISDYNGVMRLFANELDKAKKIQRKQGNKARYREVHWVEPEMEDDDSGDDTTRL
jgi:hypothetical protein